MGPARSVSIGCRTHMPAILPGREICANTFSGRYDKPKMDAATEDSKCENDFAIGSKATGSETRKSKSSLTARTRTKINQAGWCDGQESVRFIMCIRAFPSSRAALRRFMVGASNRLVAGLFAAGATHGLTTGRGASAGPSSGAGAVGASSPTGAGSPCAGGAATDVCKGARWGTSIDCTGWWATNIQV